MNETIANLAEQAAQDSALLENETNLEVFVGDEVTYQIPATFIKQFAELIVRECMDVVRDINQEYDGGSTVVNAADEIAEHFGVEE